jgi:hypothetical protein
MRLLGGLTGLLLWLTATCAPVWAQDSAYTRMGDCTPRNAPAGFEYFNAFLQCEGYGGWPVFTGSTDGMSRLAFGARNLAGQLAETPITTIEGRATAASTIEWRVNGQTPFATIARWQARLGPQVVEDYLVVSALDSGRGACHVAYVDARAVDNAEMVARRAADRMAPGFQCGSRGPFRIGAAEAQRLMARR